MDREASCTIELAPTGESFYFPGETISGSIKLPVTASGNIRHMEMAILGQVKCKIGGSATQYTAGINKTETANLFAQNPSSLVSLTNGISSYEDGYQLPFSIQLPENLPPTLACVGFDIPYIEYSLHVKIKRSGDHHDICSQTSIMVRRQISRSLEVKSLEGEGSNFMGLRIHGKIMRNYLLIDNPNISLELEIQNPRKITIKGATVKLIQRRELHGYSGGEIIFEESLPDILDFQETDLHKAFKIPVIPNTRLCVPTGNYKYPDDPNRVCSVFYELEVEFKIRILPRNLNLRFPLIVVNSEPSPEAGIEGQVQC